MEEERSRSHCTGSIHTTWPRFSTIAGSPCGRVTTARSQPTGASVSRARPGCRPTSTPRRGRSTPWSRGWNTPGPTSSWVQRHEPALYERHRPMNPELDALYQEIILDHYKNPHHKGLRDPYEVEVHHVNPTCGDEVTLRVHLSDGVVSDVSYDSVGCSISQASASVMTDLVIGKPVGQALAIHE